MAQVRIGDPHGLFRVFVGLVDTAGYNFGTVGPGAAEGTTLAPYTVRFAQSAEFGLPDRTTVDFTGGDVWTGSYVYGITSLGTFELTLSTVEADLIAFLSESAVDNTENTRQTIFSENIMLPTPPQAFMMTVFRLQSKEAGSKGANKFMTIVIPRAWVAPKGISGAPSFQSAGTYGYTITPTIGDRAPWGPLFSSYSFSFENDEGPNFYIISDYPLHTVGFIANAAAASDDVTLTFLPYDGYDYSSPNSANDPVNVYIDGTQTNATSVNTTTGVVTVPAGTTFTGGEYIGILYESETYEASP